MADPTVNRDIADDTGEARRRGSTRGLSRWQKVVGIIGLVVVLLVGVRMVMAVTGGGGAGMHGGGGQVPAMNQEQRTKSQDGGGPAPAVNQEQETDPEGGGHVPPPWVPQH